MKKILFTAIAMVAFGLGANAQTDEAECLRKANNHADGLKDKGYSDEQIDASRAGYYQGCLDQKKENKEPKKKTKIIMKSGKGGGISIQ